MECSGGDGLTSNEYLPTLMERQKWRSRKENIKVGDLVLLADENYPRGEWPIARVWEVVADDDGCMRVAKVKTASMGSYPCQETASWRGEN